MNRMEERNSGLLSYHIMSKHAQRYPNLHDDMNMRVSYLAAKGASHNSISLHADIWYASLVRTIRMLNSCMAELQHELPFAPAQEETLAGF